MRGGRVAIGGEVRRRPASETQRAGLDGLSRLAAGSLVVDWNGVKGSPATVGNLHFARPEASSREVWTAFLAAHFDALAAVWGIADREDVAITSQSSAGEGAVVLHGERRRDGIPVDGEFVEAFVTTGASRLGPGVLYRLNIVADAARIAASDVPRTRWIAEARARESADTRWIAETGRQDRAEVAGNARDARLRLSCGARCQPYWSFKYADGWNVRVDAVSGEVLSAHQHVDHIGPLRIQGRPPGSTSGQSIRFRGANVVDASTGVSLGETNPTTGEHSFTTSTPVLIGLEGPLGVSNPYRYGRVERQRWDGAAWVSVPFRRSWTPSSEPSRDFGSPDAWAPNSDMTLPFPHSTELLYGWFSYWQDLMRNTVSVEVTERLAFVLNSDTTLSGIACTSALSGNFSSPTPDPNGSATFSTVTCAIASNDDVNTSFTTDGDSIWTAAHEYGHTVNNCAAQSGAGCDNVNPVSMNPVLRPSLGDWRIAIHGAQTELVPNALSHILTRFTYNNTRDGVSWNTSWQYASYDATSDDFGTASQSAPSQLSCPSQYTCGAGYQCVKTDQNYYQTWPNGGLCAQTCTLDSDCPSGLYCYPQPLLPSGTASVCWYNSYRNKFWDTVGARLAYTTSWDSALALTLSASGGQSNNPTRDLVLGADSYYARYATNAFTRYEATRAIRSVYSGSGFIARDDFADLDVRGTTIPARSNSWTPIWWGNGLYQYPFFEDSSDADTVVFRGLAGSTYRVESWFMDISGSPDMHVWKIDDPSIFWSSSTGALTTASLPSTGWYVASFWGASGAQRWQGRLRVESSSDDLSADTAEALPMAHGYSANATTSAGDTDAFQIHTPTSGTSLEINVTGLSAGTISLIDPSGGTHSTYTITSSPATWWISSLPSAGHWTWKVKGASSASYTTTAWLGCGFGSPACDTSPGTRTTRESWGDNFAGRLPNDTYSHDYEVSLEEGDRLSVSVSDTSQPCSATIEVYAPTSQAFFNGQPVMTWTDGAAVSDAAGNAQGVGGAITAPTTGTYRFRVRPPTSGSCGYYRIHFARAGSTRSATPMPAW